MWWASDPRRSPRAGGRLVCTAAAGVLLLACDGESPAGDRERYSERVVVVARVTDGDTAILEDGTSVRYIGIDAPEARPTPQCGAEAATAANVEMVEGRPATILLDPAETRDRFGRLLAYLEVDGAVVNVELVRRGVACAFPFGETRRFREPIAAAEREALEAGRGVWGACPRLPVGCP